MSLLTNQRFQTIIDYFSQKFEQPQQRITRISSVSRGCWSSPLVNAYQALNSWELSMYNDDIACLSTKTRLKYAHVRSRRRAPWTLPWMKGQERISQATLERDRRDSEKGGKARGNLLYRVLPISTCIAEMAITNGTSCKSPGTLMGSLVNRERVPFQAPRPETKFVRFEDVSDDLYLLSSLTWTFSLWVSGGQRWNS